MNCRKLLLTPAFGLFLTVLFSLSLNAQIQRVGTGLSFTSGYEFNGVEVGNPGLKLKTWVTLDKKNNFHIVPTLTAFNRNVFSTGYYTVSNYLFLGDLDAQAVVYWERTLKIVAFAGANVSYMNSVVAQNDPKYPLPEYAPTNTSDRTIGANIGAGLELRMAAQWDMNVSAKYVVSRYSQVILSVEGVYFFKKRRRSFRR